MRRQRRSTKLLALMAGVSLLAAACGDDDGDTEAGGDDGGDDAAATEDVVPSGQIDDYSAFSQGPVDHIDSLLSTEVSASQVGGSLYDGLTQVDYSDPENPEVRGMVAESWDSNEDATVWTFQIREGLRFSDGTDVLPSSFVRGWEIGSDPEFAGDYSYLYTFIEGGAEKLDGEADSISGVEADDEAMTLTVTLASPWAEFPAAAGFKIFDPMPEAREELDDQSEWERTMMVGNGPFMIAEEWSGEGVVMTANPEWDGTLYDEELGLPNQPYVETVNFVVSQDQDSAYNSFEAGDGQIATMPSGRIEEAVNNYNTTIDDPVLGAYYFQINQRDDRIGGEENLLLRQAISQAIDREDINTTVYNDTRALATGITPPGIPGFEEGLCDYCSYDPEAAEAAYQEWLDAGNELSEPLPIQFNADAGHEPVIDIMIGNLEDIGIPAVGDPIPSDTYFGDMAEGACVICRSGWIADYPTYDNFMFDLFHGTALDGNNYGYINEDFDDLIDDAKAATDEGTRDELNHEAEQILLNEDIGTIPINWYKGQWVYSDEIANLEMTPDMHITWETVQLAD